MNYSILLLTLLGILSDTIELTYDVGVFTRRHVLPFIVYTYCACQFYSQSLIDSLVSVDHQLQVQPVKLGFG